jgi:NAD(P)-dependent dehydrogenase (short-subunit alcohol dehydrogenase family)
MQQFAASIPLGRAGHAEEVGAVIAFLASDSASYIHGETIEINGGQLMV